MRTRVRGSGFTLVEVLIGLSLLSLLMLGLLATLGTFGRSGSRLEEQAQHLEEVRLVSGLLRELVATARAEERPPREDGRQLPYFIGQQNELVWLGSMPARHGVGGLHWLRLSVRDHHGYRDLVLQYQPYVLPELLENEVQPDWGLAEPVTLARDVEAFAVQYQGLAETGWETDWVEQEVLPALLRFEISALGVAWPLLQIRLERAELRPELSLGV